MPTLRVRSNVARFGTAAYPGVVLQHTHIGPGEGLRALARSYRAALADDVVLIGSDCRRLLGFCLLSLVWPRRFRLVGMDIVLPPPRGAKARVLARVRRWLLRRVDHFIVHQRDLAGYDKHYGVSPQRSTFVRFKVNVWERLLEHGAIPASDDGFLLCAGRTARDMATFVRACELSGVPALMLRHSAARAREHGSEIPEGTRPPNLRELVHDDAPEAWLEIVARARAIVLAITPGTINAAGISTLLTCLALGKPVIMSHCPATADVVSEREVALVPWGDAPALAAAIKRVYGDSTYRAELIARGKEFAAACQGEARLYRDVLAALTAVAPPR
jgi:hypothetical protein